MRLGPRNASATANALFFFALLACVTLAQTFASPSWPRNHEHNTAFLRTVIYASHIAQGDPLPVWSSMDNFRFGSPEPVFYHKLFYLVTGPVYLLTGSLKAALLLALCGFLVLGAFGLYRLLLDLGASTTQAVCGGLLLIAANYTVTNWLTRGAMAEFTAAMIIPWALLAVIVSARRGEATHGLGFALAFLLLSHSVLAYLFALLAASAVALLLLLGRVPARLLSPPSIARAVIPALCMVGPYLYAMHAFASDYDLGRFLPPTYWPENQFRSFADYLWPSHWRWGASWNGYTVQLDWPVLALTGIAAVRLLGGGRGAESASNDAPLALLIVLLAICALLQTPLGVFFYESVPGASYIQFPWRLLALATPIAIAVAVVLSGRAFAARANLLVGLTLAWSLVICGAFAPIQYGSLPRLTDDVRDWVLSRNGEYVPVAATPEERRLNRAAVLEQVAEKGCTFLDESGDIEPLTLRYRLRCRSSAVAALPIFRSSFHRVVHGGTTTDCATVQGMPSLCAIAVQPGENLVEVRVPTLASVFGFR